MRSARKSPTGVVIVAAIGIGVWWVPRFASFLLLPPLLLGLGVGLVARYSNARPSALVTTAIATTAVVFGFFVVRLSSYGVHNALGNVMAFGALIVAEAALAAGAGASLGGRKRRNLEAGEARSA